MRCKMRFNNLPLKSQVQSLFLTVMKSEIILLHGALGSEKQFDELKALLSSQFEVYTFNFSGHGKMQFCENGMGIKQFALELKQFIEKNNLAPANVFGYSMGGYVALYAAANYPVLMAKVFTLATKFDWNTTTAAKEAAMLNPQAMETKIPAFAKMLNERHAHWQKTVKQTAALITQLGYDKLLYDSDYKNMAVPTVISVGDVDNMVSIEESVAVKKLLPHASLLVMPSTLHPFEKVNATQLAFHIGQFFN
jgi:pimeloyl-ACP methyl ester carboxylesterase